MRTRLKNMGRIGLLAVMAVLALSGCKTGELEDKNFPLMAIVDYDMSKEQVGFAYIFPKSTGKAGGSQEAGNGDEGSGDVPMAYGDSFTDALEKYENRLNKEADYNHLKVLVMKDAFVEKTEAYEEMLEWCQKEESYPRNTYVCITKDVDSLQEAKGNLSDDLGTYVEQLLENHEYGRERELPTLGDLIDEKENRRKSWQVPVLTVEDKTILWNGQYKIGGK